MLIALLLAAQSQTVAVLEFRDKVPKEQRIDSAYLSDQVRAAVKELLPDAKVITRENMLVLLEASGKKLEECEGECEVDTGRRIGADLVVSGELLRFGTQYKLNMKLHDTRSGELLSGAVAAGATADELDRALRPAVGKLLAPLVPKQLPERSQAAKHAKTLLISPWALLGYASVSVDSSALAVGQSTSASGIAYGLGGEVLLHVAGPVYLGGFLDFAVLPKPGSDNTNAFLAGGAAQVDLADVALSAGVGWANLSGGLGSGWGALGALKYDILRFQVTWRSVSTTTLATTNASTTALCGQAGIQLTF